MIKLDISSVIIGSVAGGLFSFLSAYVNLSGFGILLSNVVAGFVAVFVSEVKEDYIITGGVPGILSSFIMVIIAFLLPFTPLGFSNLDVFGFVSVAISISGGGFILGMIGGAISKKVSG
ncbi:hypothetical protein [Methanobacterium sp.]|uniref:hypothetical protein n=1 Tax=Methanobacterium sp. TaxID=2164 RepID=UPI003C721AB9